MCTTKSDKDVELYISTSPQKNFSQRDGMGPLGTYPRTSAHCTTGGYPANDNMLWRVDHNSGAASRRVPSETRCLVRNLEL